MPITKKNEQSYQWILKKYPSVISKEQLYKLCNISKKTAQHYLENGLIPCEHTGKKTHRYLIKTVDVVDFLLMRDATPNGFHAPAGWYKKTSRKKAKHGKYVRNLSPGMKQKLHKAIEQKLLEYPDVLTTKQVAEITGYSPTAVSSWCATNRLHHFMINRTTRIPQSSFLTFLTNDNYYHIYVKASKQLLAMQKEQQ